MSPIIGLAQNCDTSAVGLNQNYPHVYFNGLEYPQIDVTCLDSVVSINLNVHVSCSSIAADGSNFMVVLSNGRVIVPGGAKAIDCINDSTKSISIQFNEPFFFNMYSDFLVGASNDGNYIVSACAKRPWLSDSIKLQVDGCFVTDIELTSAAQTAPGRVDLAWELGEGTIYAPFPNYLFSSYQIYRKLAGQPQFAFVDSTSNINITQYSDQNLPGNYIGQITYRIAAKLLYAELGDDTAHVNVVLKTSPVAYPVPFQTQLELALTGDDEKEVSIFTQQGLPMFSVRTEDFYITIQTDSWPKGVYFIRISGKEETLQKIVKF